MAVLEIRNLPDEVHAQLRVRAANAGRSIEAEATAILAAACAEEPVRSTRHLAEWVDRLYGRKKPRGVVADLIARRRREANRESVNLSKPLRSVIS